ncbi:putative disease resistance protein RGA3 [Macadamia integrifolia]|uniref:putative disease resistance protein RGA3 n=1 Tax=Macadamia integrifolia TaxID=60698 RepID=UPI001C5329DD|nr:putative disease resistance protein RGA3 [Macadamia integrifolia]
MAGAILSAFLQVVFENLASPVIEESASLWGVENDLKRLSRTLSRIRAVLEDADERQIKEEAVKIWLRDLKDVAYDVDDILDEFSTRAQQFKLDDGFQSNNNQVWSFFSSFSSKRLLSQFDLAAKIKEIVTQLDEIQKDSSHLQLREGFGLKRIETRERPQTSSFIDESYVFGREEEKLKIIDFLVSEDCRGKGVSVIPIVGMGGSGKTTLAQLVYNDERVRKHFELRMWVCVSEDFDITRLTKSIIQSATRNCFGLMDLDPLQVILEEVLNEKRFLLVLDDVWNEKSSDWDVLRVPFRVGSKGSKIVLTTRSEIVSSIMGTVPAHHLGYLSDEHCWSLFAHRAFSGGLSGVNPNLERIGKEIIKKCQGLPLAAKTIGGLLHTKHDPSEWEVILNSKIWDLPEDLSDILPALKLSYHHLPASLKRCFVYCSIFPNNYVFDREKLVQLWMAEGFIQYDGRKQIEDIGSDYFNDLLRRSFFQCSYDHRRGQEVHTMHDLIHGLAQSIAADEYFRMADAKTYSISRRARYSSLLCGNIDPSMFGLFYKCKNLRTFLSLCEQPNSINQIPLDFFLKLKSLRVLDFCHTRITELPSSVDNLTHLRFLDVSHTRIKMLPEALSRLYNLQTLKLKGCFELLRLPKEMKNLVNLQHLEVEPYSRLTSMPPHVGMITNLQTLSTFIVGKETGCGIGELKNMMSLRGSLSLSRLENVDKIEEACEARLFDKQYIHKLEMIWSRGDAIRDEVTQEKVLNCLRPHTDLKELSILHYCGVEFPSWIYDSTLTNLVSLRLLYCQKCKMLPSLGQLPFLKNLYIGAMNNIKYVGHELCGSQRVKGFPSLQVLTFASMPYFEEWSGPKEGEFCCLSEISFSICHKLRKLSCLPPALRTLNISNCRSLTSIPRLPSIQNLAIQYCDEILLLSLTQLTTLSFLDISGLRNLTMLPTGLLKPLTVLEEIKISFCDELMCLSDCPGDLQNLVSLKHLEISDCPNLTSLAEEVLPSSIEHFVVSSCPNLRSLPKGMGKLTSLQELEIKDCEQLATLPEGMKNLSSLQLLEIFHCPQIQYLPEDGLPTKLQHLSICDCPILQLQCQNQGGQDWHKVVMTQQ